MRNQNLKASTFKVKKEIAYEILIANAFLKIGYKAMNNYFKLQPKITPQTKLDDHFIRNTVPEAIAGSFNLSHGFELLLKSIMKTTEIPDDGSHNLTKHLNLIMDKVPELQINIQKLEKTFGRKDPLDLTELFQKIKYNYRNARYVSQKKANVTFINLRDIVIVITAFALTFSGFPQQILGDWSN